MTRKKYVKMAMARLGVDRNEANRAAKIWRHFKTPYKTALEIEIAAEKAKKFYVFYKSEAWRRLRQRVLAAFAGEPMLPKPWNLYKVDPVENTEPEKQWTKENPYILPPPRYDGPVSNCDGFIAPPVIFDEIHGAGGGRHE